MQTFIVEHGYLVCCLVYLVVVLVLGWFTLPREQFRLLHYSGLAETPAAVFLYFLEDKYWSPIRLGGWRLGIEDFLISYVVGAMAWYLVAVVLRRRLRAGIAWKTIIRRYAVAAVGCDVTFLLAVWVGFDPMTVLLITCLLATVALLGFRPRNWRLAAVGVVLFPVVWFVVVAASMRLVPDFLLQWNLDGPWGWPAFGVPMGEIAWAVVYGAFWPLFTGFVFDVTVVKTTPEEVGKLAIAPR